MPLQRTRLLPVARAGLSFNGVNQYAVVPHSDALNIAPGNRITIAMWANPTGWQSGYPAGVVIDKRTEGQANYDWGFSTYTMDMRVHAGGAAYSVTVPHSLNTWSFYAMVLDGSWLGGYLNGELKASRSDVPASSGNTVNLFIGQSIWGSYRAAGIIASVLIYSRALTDDEILWNFYYPDNPVRSGLVLWLHWDSIDTANNKWYDKSGFGNHATLYNNPVKEDVLLPPKRVLSPTRTLTPVR